MIGAKNQKTGHFVLMDYGYPMIFTAGMKLFTYLNSRCGVVVHLYSELKNFKM